jgi:hypothetical protein
MSHLKEDNVPAEALLSEDAFGEKRKHATKGFTRKG